MSDEILTWIKFKYYPIVNWIQETFSTGKLEQRNVNATSYGKWWLPIIITITDQFSFLESIKVCLTSLQSSTYLTLRNEQFV